MSETIICSATLRGSYIERQRTIATGQYDIIATATLAQLHGNTKAHFSVTAEIPMLQMFGCLHRETLSVFPQLKPIIALHLSDSDGVPMHAGANGWYWMAGALGGAGERFHGGNSERQHWHLDGTFDGYRFSNRRECMLTLCEHLRIELIEAEALHDELQAIMAKRKPESLGYQKQRVKAKARFCEFADAQRERWKREAVAGIAIIQHLRGAS